ncbi:alpha/beta fold hydrolase [Tsukamurella asaccharolytica]|uniref:Alpha/beta fold hydrolase n=2 Tax=Tsukamurella asaccharolytica TaxID=2592067 RepID=A0A5C5RG84_9ACTN|nr:alpha/beta fold hydrolase [Tsukamurella asaccharolytica]
MWEPQLRSLAAAGYRAVAVDLLGFGDTAPVGRTIPLEHHAQAALDVLDALGARTFAAVGYSMGGQVALELADVAGPRLTRMLLSDTFAWLDTDEVRKGRHALADRLEAEGTAAYGEEFLPVVLGPTSVASRPEACASARAMIAAAPAAGAAAALRGRADRRDLTVVAERFTRPAAVVVGAEDAFDRGVLGVGLAEALGAGDPHVIGGAGHTPSLETPDRFDAVLLPFLSPERS